MNNNIKIAKELVRLAKILIADEIIEKNKAKSMIKDLVKSIEKIEKNGENLAENLGNALDSSKKNRYASDNEQEKVQKSYTDFKEGCQIVTKTIAPVFYRLAYFPLYMMCPSINIIQKYFVDAEEKVCKKLQQKLKSDEDSLKELQKEFKNYWKKILEQVEKAQDECKIVCDNIKKSNNNEEEQEIRKNLGETLKRIGAQLCFLLSSPIDLPIQNIFQQNK